MIKIIKIILFVSTITMPFYLMADDRNRAAEGLFGGALGGALIGGMVGGGRGAGIGAGVGAGVGLMAGASADQRARDRYDHDDNEEYYDYQQPVVYQRPTRPTAVYHFYDNRLGRTVYYYYDQQGNVEYYYLKHSRIVMLPNYQR